MWSSEYKLHALFYAGRKRKRNINKDSLINKWILVKGLFPEDILPEAKLSRVAQVQAKDQNDIDQEEAYNLRYLLIPQDDEETVADYIDALDIGDPYVVADDLSNPYVIISDTTLAEYKKIHDDIVHEYRKRKNSSAASSSSSLPAVSNSPAAASSSSLPAASNSPAAASSDSPEVSNSPAAVTLDNIKSDAEAKYFKYLKEYRLKKNIKELLKCSTLSENECKNNAHICKWQVLNRPPTCEKIKFNTLTDEPALPSWNMFTEHLSNAIVIARTNLSLNLPFAARSSLPFFDHPDPLSGAMNFHYDKVFKYLQITKANWTFYNSKQATSRTYKANELSSCDDKHIFISVFKQCFSFVHYKLLGKGMKVLKNEDTIDEDTFISNKFDQIEHDHKSFIERLWSDLSANTNKNESPPYTKLYILSKPVNSNMSWHIDKNTGSNKTDVVIYIIIGPVNSYSVFFTFKSENEAVRKALHNIDDDKNPLKVDVNIYLSKKQNFWDNNLHRIPTPQNILQKVKENLLINEYNQDIDAALESLHTFALWGRTGDIIVFDGSVLHGVSNNVNSSDNPQLVMAINVGVNNGFLRPIRF